MNLEVNLGGIRLANPVVMASGRRRSVSRLWVGGCFPARGPGVARAKTIMA
jgi:dihydroorotate dehydrogenase